MWIELFTSLIIKSQKVNKSAAISLFHCKRRVVEIDFNDSAVLAAWNWSHIAKNTHLVSVVSMLHCKSVGEINFEQGVGKFNKCHRQNGQHMCNSKAVDVVIKADNIVVVIDLNRFCWAVVYHHVRETSVSVIIFLPFLWQSCRYIWWNGPYLAQTSHYHQIMTGVDFSLILMLFLGMEYYEMFESSPDINEFN